MRSGSAAGQPRSRLPAALLNSEMASAASSSVGRLSAATTMILEGSANGRFKGEVRLGVAVGDSIFAGKFVPRDGASAISLCTGATRIFVWAFEVFAGAEVLVAARPPEPRRMYREKRGRACAPH